MAGVNQVKNIIRVGQKAKVPVWIWSTHGQGKSEAVKQVAAEQGIECIDIRAALTEAGDWMGLPYVDKEKGVTVMKFAPAPFLPPNALHGDDGSRGILFLDELNRARQDVLNCVFQLALDGRIGNHYVLPKGWYIVVAANPSDSDYQVTGNEPALMGRFCHVQLLPTASEWLTHAKGSKVRDDLYAFIQDNEKMLGNNKSGFKLEQVRENPRAWVLYGKMVDAAESLNLLDEVITDIGAGLVGATAAVQYAEYRKSKFKRLSAEKILTDYAKVRKDVIEMVKNGRLDALKDAIDALLETGKFDYKATMKDADKLKNIASFFTDCPPDVTFTGISKIVKEYPPEFVKALLNVDGKEKTLYKRVVALSEG